MSEGKGRFGYRLYCAVIVLLVAINVIPLAGEYFLTVTMHGWKSYYIDYHLTDEQGRGHAGLLGLATMPLADGEIFQYAFEAGEGVDTDIRKQKVNRGLDEDGFVWGDRGHLWSEMLDYLLPRRGWEEGKRIGRKIEPWQMGELSGPGSPWDVKGPHLSVLGHYPLYVVDYENENFKLYLEYRSRSKGWYLYNRGETMRSGDFGRGNMSELPCDVKGTITHKKADTTYSVKGWGCLEDALGEWNWFEWGNHNWFSSHYPNGWSAGFWLAPDDWQWGYQAGPVELWVYDASQQKYYVSHNVEILSYEWDYEGINGVAFPKSYRIRAVTDAGVMEVSARSVSFKPILAGVKYVPLDIKMSYSRGAMEGTFTYLDGTSVELRDGVGTMEYYPRYVPDMIWITPWSLSLVALLIGGRRIRMNRGDKVRVRRAVLGMALSLSAVALLTIIWM